jgi:maltose/moltooligosaccharide transporter
MASSTIITEGNQPHRPRMSFAQLWNMSFGFLGIQFGFALQNANVSRIFESLGASKDEIPILWLAAPVTGLLVQPIIGYLSDRTWHPYWGRRRPFFAIGAILATIALVAMPNSSVLWVAAGVLWVMDASINISMEPFRAFVGDVLPAEQRTSGFAMQSFFIGLGSVIASMLPYIFTNWVGLSDEPLPGESIAPNVKWAFYLGAIAFFGAVMWTVFTTKEYAPDDPEEFKREREEMSFVNGFKETVAGLFKMPKTMQQLALVQFFSWLGLFSMWIYTTTVVASNVYGATDPQSAAYNEGADWVGVCFAVYNGVAALVAFALPVLARHTSRKTTHMLCLLIGGIGLASIFFVTNEYTLLASMVAIGIAWASILSMPYAILAGVLPVNKMGYYMGVFNFFIVIPQIIASVTLGFLVRNIFGGDPAYALFAGGACMVIAALATIAVQDDNEKN